MKAGAWTLCPACDYQPSGAEDLAKSLMVFDNCIAPDKLEEFAARRQRGEPWNFSPELVEVFKQRLAALIPMTSDGQPAPIEGEAANPATQPPAAQSGQPAPVHKRWWQFWR
jgi:hypothetical protein